MSKVFEFHFTPYPPKENIVFDTFCFLPDNKTHKKLGNLYLAGELKNVSTNSKDLLSQLANIIGKNHYSDETAESGDTFQKCLDIANDFLSQETQQENIFWIGNLHFAVVALSPSCLIKISRVGNLKILLLRDGGAFDIGSSFENPTTTERIFSNVMEGELNNNDRLLILTEEVFMALNEEKILERLAITKNPKMVKQIFKEKKKILKQFSGVCLLIFAKKKRVFPTLLPSLNSLSPWRQRIAKTLFFIFLLAVLLFFGYLFFNNR